MFKLEPHHRGIPDEVLIADVKNVASQLDVQTITIDKYNECGRFHATTLTRRFGSWFNVLERAGLKRTRNLNITNDALFENLANVWAETGLQPKYASLTKAVSSYSAGTYEKRFGSWRKALEAFVAWANEGTQPTIAPNRARNRIQRTSRQVNWRLRAQVLMRDGAQCQLCGAGPKDDARLHVDHIFPWSKGGETVLENLRILCEKCNIGKSDIMIECEAQP